MLRKNYFYKAPKIKVLKFLKNNTQMKNSDYSTHETAPFYPIFDEKGKKHYKLKIIGTEKFNKQECLKIKVNAIKKDFHTFQGYIWINKNTLNIIRQKGTPSDSHWAVKEFKIDYIFSSIKGVPVLIHGKVIARIHVFLLMPDSRFFYDINSIENKPIIKEQK